MTDISNESGSVSNARDDFRFAMGDHTASFLGDRLYVRNHMWAAKSGDGIFRFGLTEYAVRLLQDVYFLDWVVEPPQPLKHRMTIGAIESKKAESDLFSPIEGTMATINDATIDDPSLINADPYGDGWLIEIRSGNTLPDTLITPEQYAEHLVERGRLPSERLKVRQICRCRSICHHANLKLIFA